MLVEGKFSKQLYRAIKNSNSAPISLDDIDKAIQDQCTLMEQLVYEAILSATATVTILPGSVITVGSPTTQTNVTPIVIEGTIT